MYNAEVSEICQLFNSINSVEKVKKLPVFIFRERLKSRLVKGKRIEYPLIIKIVSGMDVVLPSDISDDNINDLVASTANALESVSLAYEEVQLDPLSLQDSISIRIQD